MKDIIKNAITDFVKGHQRLMQKTLPTLCFLAAAFLLGRNLAAAVQENRMEKALREEDLQTVETGQKSDPLNLARQTEERRTEAQQTEERRTSEGQTEEWQTEERRTGAQQTEERRTGTRQTEEWQTSEDAREVSASVYTAEDTRMEETQLIDGQVWGLLFTENWGLGFGESGKCPTGNASTEELKKYNAYYLGDTSRKKIYLTFDCGYENGNTEALLDALKKHEVHATFFVVGHFLESAPELVNRMVEEGHTVGNHTYHHPDMSKISDREAFCREMDDVRDLYREVTGEEMAMYYRPPQGKYSTANLQMAKELGYSTFFWSLAYVDWNVDSQPTHEEALEKLTRRIHPGAIVLLHNTSKTNAEILDELLTKWEEMGYSFGTLGEVAGETK